MFFKHNTAYALRISDWSSDVCSSDLHHQLADAVLRQLEGLGGLLAREHPLDALQAGDVPRHGGDIGTLGQVDRGVGAEGAVVDHIGIRDWQDGTRLAFAEERIERALQVEHVGRAVGVVLGVHAVVGGQHDDRDHGMNAKRSEEHTSELQSLMRISYAVFCLKKKTTTNKYKKHDTITKQQKYSETRRH